MMFRFKSCQRCAGDLVLESDHYGTEWRCLQCSRRYEIAQQRSAPLPRINAQLALFAASGSD